MKQKIWKFLSMLLVSAMVLYTPVSANTYDDISILDITDELEVVEDVGTVGEEDLSSEASVFADEGILEEDSEESQEQIQDNSQAEINLFEDENPELGEGIEIIDIEETIIDTTEFLAAEEEITQTKSGNDSQQVVEIYLSISHDDKFLFAENGAIMALKKMEVPYFDLGLYGLEKYYFVSESYTEEDEGNFAEATDYEGKVTMLHAFIYATELYYCGIDPEDAGKGYLYEAELIGSTAFSPEGATGSLYIRKFWGMDENFNYYHNYAYPLASSGWGSTADQILLKDGDVVTVGHFTSWDFHLDSLSVFNYIKAGNDIIYTDADYGEEVEFTVILAGKGGNYTTAHFPMANRSVYISKIAEMTVNPQQWQYAGTTDENGNIVMDTAYLDPGEYMVAVSGAYGNEYKNVICSTPGGIYFTVKNSPEYENRMTAFKEAFGALPSIESMTLLDAKVVNGIRESYEALTEGQKAQVSEEVLEQLEAAEAKIEALQNVEADQQQAAAVTGIIEALPLTDKLTASDAEAVKAARMAYDALTEGQKAQVSEEVLEQLEAAEAKIEALQNAEADQQQAAAATGIIEALPLTDKLTASDAEAVKAARMAYDALTDTQKALVSSETLKQLEAAEAKIAELTHVHSWNAGTITKKATCKETGVETFKCSCGETKTETIAKTTSHQYGAWTVESEATVKAAEVQKHICSVCGKEETKDAGEALTPVLEIPGKLSSFNMKKSKTEKFEVTMANGDSVSSVKSSKTKILKATLDQKTGKITVKGLKKGTSKLTITLESGKSRTYTVKVVTGTVKTSGLSVTNVTDKKLTLAVKKSHTLKSELKPFTSTQKLSYKSSNKKIAKVSSSGKITAVAPGKATITVTSGSKKVKITVTVPGIAISKSTVSVKKNKTLALKPKTFGISEKVTYTSSDTKVATVTASGKIKGIKKGTAKIIIKAGTFTKTVKVTVK